MSDSVIVTANGFPDPESLPLVSDVQFREPYSSAAINRKLRGLALPGIYSGFNPTPGTGLNVLISSGDDGGTCSFNIGEYYQLSVRQQSDVTVAMAAGTTKIIALQATYALGQETYQVNSGSTVQAAEFVLLDETATLADNQLEMCKVTIPAGTTQITSDMIDLSGRVARSLTFELSSAIDSSDEEVAANSLAVKKAIAYIESEIAAAVATKLLTVTGAAMFSSTLTVAGISYFDRVRANQYVDLGYQNGTAGTRQITFYSGSDTTNTGYINVVGSSASASVMTIKAGGIYLNGSTNLTGALSVSSTLSVSGSAVFAGALTASGAATLGSTLDVTNQINSGYRINISRSDGYPPYMNFVRNDLASTATPSSDTGVLQLIARTASDTSDPYAGRNLGLISVYMTPSGGGKAYFDARDSSGNATIKLSMDSATAIATLTGSLAISSAATVNGALSVGGNMNVGSTYTDTTSAALLVSNNGNSGTGGITVMNYQPALTLVDTSSGAYAARLRNDSGWLHFDWDITKTASDSGASFTSNRIIMGYQGQISMLGGGGNLTRGLTIGQSAAGTGLLSGTVQVAAMVYNNHGSDATSRAVGWAYEGTIGDGSTAQTLNEWVEFWGNGQTVNANASVTLMSSFRSYDKTSTSIASVYAFDGRQMTRSGVNRWNLFMQGSAPNYIRGQTIIGGTDTTLPTSSVALQVTGTSQAISDGNSFILMPATADKSYFIRGKKSDGTLHWYLGQSADSTDTVTLGNSIGGAWLTLKGDGSAASNVSTMTYSGALVAGATTVSSLTSTGGMSVSATATFGYRIMMQRSGAIPYHTFTRTDITSAPSSETEIGRLVWGYGMNGTDTWGTGGVLGYMSTFAVANGGGKVNISANNSSNATGAALLLNGYTGEATVTGTLTTTGAISTPGELVSTQNGNNIRMNNGTYSVIHRNYSGQYYILLTDSGNPTGTYNSLRPFTMALSTGAISFGTALTASSTLAVSGAASFGSSVSVSGAAALSSTLTVGGTLTASGEVITTAVNSYRMAYGNYGMFQRFDGSNWYMMFTDSGSQYGSYNSLRPITVSVTTGNVTLSATTVKGNLTATGAVYVNSGNGFLGTDGNIYGSLWGGYLSTYLANSFKNASSTDSYQGIGSYILARSSYGAAFAPGATISGSYLQAATSDGDYTGSTLTGTWMLMGYMTTTNDAHRTSLYQRVA